MVAAGATGNGGPLTPEGFQAATDVSRETLERLRAYAALLGKWQARINLVSRASLDDLWRRHMLDSAQLAPLLPADATVLTDLGSGAGFPGLVVAIITGRTTHLIESDARKAAFLREAIRIVEATAIVHNARIETLDPWPADAILARALAPLSDLIGLASRFFLKNRETAPICLFLKGANVDRELTDAQKMWSMRHEALRSASDPSGRILRIWDIVQKEP